MRVKCFLVIKMFGLDDDCYAKNLEEKLKPLFDYLQKEYSVAEEDYLISGMFSIGARLEKVKLIENIVEEINNIYNTQYKLKRTLDDKGNIRGFK